MSLSYKVRSLIEAFKDGEVNVIAHQANCFNKMGSGIAPQIAKAFPKAKEADDNTVKGDHRKLGSVSRANVSEGYIYNLYGQYYPGKNTDYAALRQALRHMASQLYLLKGSAKIGLPKIGCGIGGGDWEIVSDIIKEELSGFEVIIYVLHEYEIPKNSS